MNIEINEESLNGFSDSAKSEFSTQSNLLISNLIHEICLCEFERREANTDKEITKADVIEGALYFRKKRRRKKSKFKLFLQCLCPTLSAVAGFIFDKNNMNFVIASFVCLIISTGITFYLLMGDDYNE